MKAAAALLGMLLFAASVFGQGTTVYMRHTVTAGSGDVRLGDIVRTTSTPAPAASEMLARSIATMGDRILYLPASLATGLLAEAFGSDSIIVGSRTMVLPRDVLPEGEDYLVDCLGDFLSAQGLVGDGKVEITLLQNLVQGTVPRRGTPTFQVVKTGATTCEVSFSLAAGAGSSVSGRVSFPALQGAASTDLRVAAGTPVSVIFRKGPVTIEIPGKALASASVGERVSVRVAESQKKFSGMLLEGKAVDVELP
jgi:hypothetical protein